MVARPPWYGKIKVANLRTKVEQTMNVYHMAVNVVLLIRSCLIRALIACLARTWLPLKDHTGLVNRLVKYGVSTRFPVGLSKVAQ